MTATAATTATAAATAAATEARHRETTAVLGMVMFVASWAMLFAGLFFAYGVVRARANAWPPGDLPALPRGLPGVATGVLAASSWALQRALGRARRGAPVVGAIVAAAILGAGFLGLQAVVWRGLWNAGLRPDTGSYGSVFYGLTVFHAVHVAVGIAAMAWLALAAGRGRFSGSASASASAQGHVPVRLWAIYWHMVGVLWAVMFVTVYLV